MLHTVIQAMNYLDEAINFHLQVFGYNCLARRDDLSMSSSSSFKLCRAERVVNVSNFTSVWHARNQHAHLYLDLPTSLCQVEHIEIMVRSCCAIGCTAIDMSRRPEKQVYSFIELLRTRLSERCGSMLYP